MKVTPLLSASSTQTYVGARYLRHGDAIWELPGTLCVEGMLNEHGMKDAKPVVTPAVNRTDDDDDDEEEASVEEHRLFRRIVGKSQFLVPRRPDIAFATILLARTLAKPSKSDLVASKTSFAISVGWGSTHPQVRVFVGDHAGWIVAQSRCSNTVGGCSIIMRS